MLKDLIGPGSDLLRDSLDTNGSSLDKSELSQEALGSGRIVPVLQSDLETMNLSEQKLKVGSPMVATSTLRGQLEKQCQVQGGYGPNALV